MRLTPIIMRVTLAKTLGLIIGVIGYIIFSNATGQSSMLLIGLVGWFILLGALIGILSFCQVIPFIGMAIPAWVRGGWCGAWMGLLLVLVAYGELRTLLAETEWLPGFFMSPWWLIPEMAFWGALIDVIVTAAFGSIPWEGSGLSQRGNRS